MHNFCAVYCLAVVFFLVVCGSASTPVSKEDQAKAAVALAQNTVKSVRERAETQLANVSNILRKVDSSKSEAAKASSLSKDLAKGNEEAEKIAQKIKSLSDEVTTSHSDTKEKLTTVVNSLTPLLAEAQKLDNAPEITLPPKKDPADDYTLTNNKASALKGQAETLDGQITTALQQMDELYSKGNDMEKNAKDAKIGYSQISTIVDVAKIKTMMGEADNSKQTIQTKKNEVNGIVEEMKKLKETAPSGSMESIDKLYQKAEAELTKATSAFQRAETANGAITQQKDLAEDALTEVQKTDIDLETAKQEANKAKTCLKTVEKNVLQLKSEVQPAETSATNAKGFKEEMEQALLNAKKKPNTEQGKETTDDNTPVADGTDSHQKDTTIQPTSEYLPDQIDNSADKLKDALIKGAQNVPTTALTGGKAPAPGAKNDSAMTVSVPLLVALIASAVWQ